MSLRNVEQEHTLLVDERGKFVLVPYDQIKDVAGANASARAFVFERKGQVWVTFWHASGEGFLDLPLAAKRVMLMRELGKPLAVKGDERKVTLPLGERRYLRFDHLTRNEVIAAFQKATIR
jgi:hypothetical protein